MCIDFLPDGRLLIVDSAQRRLFAMNPTGVWSRTPSCPSLDQAMERHRGRRSWERLRQQHRLRLPRRRVPPGLVALVTPDGNVRQIAGDVAFPNGMAITPEGRTLIVAESYASQLTAFQIGADGGLSDRRVWAKTPGDHPDGICIDAAGAVWYADVGNQHCVRVREGGEVLATSTWTVAPSPARSAGATTPTCS